MKILVVTSEVTFVPENYNLFLKELISECAQIRDLSLELVILKNNSFMLPLKGLGLWFMGARQIGLHLIRNSLRALTKDRKDLPVKMHFFENPNSEDFIQFVKNYECDLLINARTRYIYKNKILKTPKLGAINIHHGLLPGYRGTMCDLWALLDGRPTGFSIHMMEKKIDNGAIIRRVRTTSPHEARARHNFAELIRESSRIEGIETGSLIREIMKTRTIPIEQPNVTANPIYTKNPDYKTIKEMIKKGIVL